MSWTKKHFVAIAEVLRGLPVEGNSRHEVVAAFVAMLKTKNGRFDDGKFAEASGGRR